ncbi:pyruvate dehydrogenase complex dihydrolipoamide acetyltransferase [Sphingomonas daechungensis]|uniref:Acetyltransferase component of pyruvate dehydrogenase complex n=1 Tax=Sphingomonas daechungensis TaxID=1176646 RepID=A0ABX6T1D5_9SPHN|nr:pyruvate dehydrogenase complex dihydrolipoamide acetyltransferase [Sphingomonas daechungensis]QNP43631.1 pyruvate dehydrogenase complex dihydrolipoamide acetyltransferase [Sphingomonas daechungensis]
MPTELKMPALSPTMEEGTLAKWLVKEGDDVKSGDILAEIETDKATMEFEAVDEGKIAKILVPEGTDGVKVGAPIAILAGEGEDVSAAAPKADTAPAEAPKAATPAPKPDETPKSALPEAKGVTSTETPPAPAQPAARPRTEGDRVKASPLARRLAQAQNIDLNALQGSGPDGRIVRADIDAAVGKAPAAAPAGTPAAAPALGGHAVLPGVIEQAIPHEAIKLSNIRKTIARRLTESKQQIPHIYLTVDIQLDALLKLRAELNAGLESRGVKLSVNDLLIKALAQSLIEVPECNVSFAGDQLFKYSRADVSVAVSIPAGLITPIIVGADTKSVSAISTEMKDLAGRAKEGKLQPQEYQGGTASLSNMGMYGIKQFEAVINPPQGMIMAIGAGEKRPYVINDSLQIASVMSATGSFDHRAIDGADGAKLMQAFKRLVENPLGMLA